MSKQDIIGKGIEKLTEDRFRYPAESAGLNWDRYFNSMLARDILYYLQSQGGCLKVERELPEDWYNNTTDKQRIEETFKEAGYVAVVSLIEKEVGSIAGE